MVDTVKKAFHILNFIAENQGKLGLTDISRALKINKTTTFRNLKTLEELKLIEKNGPAYYLGMTLFSLGNRVYLKELLVNRSHLILENLCHEVNETVNLAMLFENQALHLDKIESTRSLQIQSSIGNSLPLYCTSLGKSILSILPNDKLDRTLVKLKIKPVTRNTIKNKTELRSQIAEIRARGYSTDNEEFEEGLTCVSVPLYLKDYDFFGSVSLSGPSIRFTRTNVVSLAEKIKLTVMGIKNIFKNNI